MPNLGMGELVIILLILLLVFGAGRLPQIGEGIGKAIKSLKRGLQTDDNIDVEPQPKSTVKASHQGGILQPPEAHKSSSDVHEAEVVNKK